MLSAEASGEPGRWESDRVPYLNGIMDAVTEPGIETTVLMKSAQSGGTEVILNAIGYFIHRDPSPMLIVQPNAHEMGAAFSKDRLAPMVRDTPALRYLVREPKRRDSGNTIYHKVFPGGHITIASAQSPASLASRPCRIVCFDEVDRYNESAGTEGDPIDLGKERADTFKGRKKIMLVSTPGLENESRIYQAWLESDQRRYFVPCLRCGAYQVLEWGEGETFGLKFEREDGKLVKESVRYRCRECGGLITEGEREEMLEAGEWRPTASGDGSTAGFHINKIYSPLSRWSDIVEKFLKAKGNRERMKAWVNLSLGIPFKDERKKIDHVWLFNRRDKYPAPVPAGGLVLVAGADIQVDRIEIDVRAWGRGLENWGVEYRILYGDPARPDVWQDLAAFLLGEWEHASGATMQIAAAGIDSGFLSQMVYAFCKRYVARRFWAVKGDAGTPGTPLIRVSSPRTGKNRRPVDLTTVGLDTAKSTAWAFLNITDPGPGCCHWPIGEGYDARYFEQLTGEAVKPHLRGGREVNRWVQVHDRVEAWDCFIYGLAAVHRLNPLFDVIDARLNGPYPEDDPSPSTKPRPVRPRSSWMDGAR